MINLLQTMQLLLTQTQREKSLTVLYVALFVLFLFMMVLDGATNKKYTISKSFGKMIIILFFIAAIVLLILYFLS